MKITLQKKEEPFGDTWYNVHVSDGDKSKFVGCRLNLEDAENLYKDTILKSKEYQNLEPIITELNSIEV